MDSKHLTFQVCNFSKLEYSEMFVRYEWHSSVCVQYYPRNINQNEVRYLTNRKVFLCRATDEQTSRPAAFNYIGQQIFTFCLLFLYFNAFLHRCFSQSLLRTTNKSSLHQEMRESSSLLEKISQSKTDFLYRLEKWLFL